MTQTEDASLKTVVVAAAANLTPSDPAADPKIDGDPIGAMVLPAGVEELTVHADARHGDLLEQMR